MRMKNAHASSSLKRATNLSINSDLLAQAKELGVNLSALLERSLAEEVRSIKTKAWLEENAKAIEAYNEGVNANGSFGDAFREF